MTNLARLTGVHRNTLGNPSSERLQGRMREVMKVISAATECTGAADKAIYWYRNGLIADYGHRTAAELVPDGQVEAALAFVGDLENGARMKVAQAGKDWIAYCKEFVRCNALHIGATNHHYTRMTFALLRLTPRIIMGIRSFFPAMHV